jgi:hypothetical protein
VYDGDGRRVKSIFNGNTTTYFVGNHYEVTGSTITKYYYAGGQRIAMRTNGTLNYLLGDHLGSTSLTTNASGQVVSELGYKAWGETRYASGNTLTNTQANIRTSQTLDYCSIMQDGTTLILTTLPNLIRLYQTSTIHWTGIVIAMPAIILFDIPIQADIAYGREIVAVNVKSVLLSFESNIIEIYCLERCF